MLFSFVKGIMLIHEPSICLNNLELAVMDAWRKPRLPQISPMSSHRTHIVLFDSLLCLMYLYSSCLTCL